MVPLAIVFLVTVGIACTGTGVAPQFETPVVAEAPEPTPSAVSIDGAIWVLESVDGQPPIAGTYLDLTISGPYLGGFDGCNSFQGLHQSGTPVVKADGSISTPPFGGATAGCPTRAALAQAHRYLEAMTQQAKARVVGDRLQIVDNSGEIALVFSRQGTLVRRLITLEGTGWRLADHGGIYGERPPTLIFLDNRTAVGTTTCRDYALGYTANAGRIRIPYKGMAGSAEPCSRDAIKREHLFIEDFGWANEYSTHYTQGALRSLRMVVRTSRGKTLTFAPLSKRPDTLFDRPWIFVRSLESRSDQSGMRWVEDIDSASGSHITARFEENTVAGSLGCHSYAYHGAGGEGSALVSWADGSMSMSQATLSTKKTCDGLASISHRQRRFLDLLGAAERYHVLEDRLVAVTEAGDALMFKPEDRSSRTRPAPTESEYSMADLRAWLKAMEEAAVGVPGIYIYLSAVDEKNQRIAINIRPLRGALEQMEAVIAKVAAPREAVVIEIGCHVDALNRLDRGKPPDQAFLAAIDYSLEAPSQVAYGETVDMTLTLQNISNGPVQVPMGGIPSHDFVISTIEGENIWRWQCGQVILDIMGGETLEPGEEMELVGEWEQVDNRGEPVPAGTYLIRGALMMDPPERLVTPPHRLEVLN
jgi:heat shock protein HslJ